MKKLHILSTVILLSLTMPQVADATLLSVPDLIFGVNSITLDMDTGFEWLDLTSSTGRSYDDLIGNDGTNEFNTGGDFNGFRYATTAEITQLWINAGIPVLDGSMTASNFNPVIQLQNLIGITLAQATQEQAIVGANNGNGMNTGTYSYFEISAWSKGISANNEYQPYLRYKSPPDYAQAVFGEGVESSYAGWDTGNWLVRESQSAVPEPATIALFSLGALGSFARRKFKKTVF